jgi:hypothetical protein
LSFESAPAVLGIIPTTDVTHDEYGFCNTTLADHGLGFYGLSADEIAHLSLASSSRPSTRGGARAGFLMKSAGAIWFVQKPLDNYEFKSEYRRDGLFFAISGRFPSADNTAGQQGPSLTGRAFLVEAVIPAATLVLKGYPSADEYRKFEWGKAADIYAPDRQRHPRRLHDLLIDLLLYRPVVTGRISLDPETPSAHGPDRSAAGLLQVDISDIDEGSFTFSDAPRLQLFDSGFVLSAIPDRQVTIAILRQVVRELLRRDAVSMRMAGDALGRVYYAFDETGRLRPNRVFQHIKTMSLRMMLGRDGLEIAVDGELCDYDPAENPQHRHQQVTPVRTYACEATMPWALLAARGLELAKRVDDF